MTEINAKEILKPFRQKIDDLDEQIITLIAERFKVVHQVGEAKAAHNISTVQPKRMEEVLDRVATLAIDRGLDPELARRLYSNMIDHAHTLEFVITGEHNE